MMSEEQLILVDERNRATGSGSKTAIHRKGLLHRAFSIFMVDEHGRIVLQQRSPQKYHSGGLWANSRSQSHRTSGFQKKPSLHGFLLGSFTS